MAIKIKRAEGTVEFCENLSLRGDWEEKNEELTAVRQTGSGRLVDGDASRLAAEIREIEERMESDTLLFRIRAVTRKRWAEAVAANPPREGEESDEAAGMHVSAMFDELLSEPGVIVSVTRKTTGEVVDFDPATEWLPLSEEMSDAQFSEFGQKVFDLNRGVIARPFSRAASRVTAGSGPSLKPPSDSE